MQIKNIFTATSLALGISATGQISASPANLCEARVTDCEASSFFTTRAGYFGEPHPVISPSGTLVIFSSDWYDSGSVDTYVIDLEDPGNIPEPVEPQVQEQITTGQPVYTFGDKIQVDFSGVNTNGNNRITIAPVRSPEVLKNVAVYPQYSETC